MSDQNQLNDSLIHSAEKADSIRRVLWQVLVLNALVSVGKIAVGALTGTISILADGLHSVIDASSNVIGLIAQRIAGQPPDEEHPYGHERFEALATLAIGGLLLLAAWQILQLAIERLLSGTTPEIGPVQFIVLIATLLVNIGVARYERQAAKRFHSSILEADARHTASDVWVTVSVLASLVLMSLGLVWLDSVVALFIVGFIAYTAWQIVQRNARVLVDAAPISGGELNRVLAGVPGVEKVLLARSRGSEDRIQVDLDVQIPVTMNAERAHHIADDLRQRVKETFASVAEVRVQMRPESYDEADYFIAAHTAAASLGLDVHEIIAINSQQGKVLEMHVEVPGGLTLEKAHRQVDALENQLRGQSNIVDVVTHIEPTADEHVQLVSSAKADALKSRVLSRLQAQFPQAEWHDMRLHSDGSGYALSVHCYLPGDMRIEAAHQLAEQSELDLRSHFPCLYRVTIHTEPEGCE